MPGCAGVWWQALTGTAVIAVQAHLVVKLEAGVRPGKHRSRHLLGEQPPPHEGTQHRAAKRLGQDLDRVRTERHEGAVEAKQALSRG